MKKYLCYLLEDMEAAISAAPPLSELSWMPFFPEQEDEDGDIPLTRLVKLSDLISFPAISFPPHHLLSDDDIFVLLEAFERLWGAWNVGWKFPCRLSERGKYAAYVREMDAEPIRFHAEFGGDVHVCDFDNGKCCPFQPDSDYCFCKEVDEIVKNDIAQWEAHVREQGLDPYRKLTPEEERALEDDMLRHRMKKRYDDDWKKYYYRELGRREQEEFNDESSATWFLDADDEDDDDDYFFLDDPLYDNAQNAPADDDAPLPDWRVDEDDDYQMPF